MFVPVAHPIQLLILIKAESLRSLLHKLEEMLKGYSPLMGESTEKAVGTAIKVGAVFAEVCFSTWRPAGG